MKQLGWTVGMFVVASCSFPRPADVDGDASTGTSCQLLAVEPSIANTDDPVTIEGTFDDTVMVNFPGGAVVAATVLGPHRASVRVPAAATTGELTVTTCGATIGSLPFRRASFSLGIGPFAANFEQTTGARQYTSLAVPRARHTSTVLGRYFYVIGGRDERGSLNSVEHALINADGTHGQFRVLPDTGLTTRRHGHSATAVGDQVYIIGGFSEGPLSSVEHASATPDGSIGPFVASTTSALVTPRHGHASVVIGRYLYVVGGRSSNVLNSVERATIAGDGTLGAFATVPTVALATARHDHVVKVIGNYVYVIGGAGSDGALDDVERASISADGSLGPFASTPGTSLAIARAAHTAAIVGDHLYVFGGTSTGGSVATIERAALDVDGSLRPFEIVSGIKMARGRRTGHTTTVIGNHLYVLGGSDDIRFLEAGERATLNTGSSLGPFAIVPGITLTSARAHCAGVVLGSHFYVLGGVADPTGVERALVNSDGSLGPFAPVPGIALTRPRDGHTIAVIGDFLYVLGGGDNVVERSTIGLDGSLGTFETVSTELVRRHSGSTSAVLGDYLYIIGGTSGTDAAANSIERASIRPDGSLGPFTIYGGSTANARSFHSTQVVGHHLYLLGGSEANTNIEPPSIYRALLDFGGPTGALGPFEIVSGISLSTASSVTAVIGSSVYAFGNTTTVQQAVIDVTSLDVGTFTIVPELKLAVPRFAEASAIIGNTLYLAGGATGRNPVNTVERAILK